jgi:cysteine and histidine-rich domain-containing protein
MSHFCYNRGCQKSYTPTDDPVKDDAACQYHPGLPYFHDAYKIWSCCQKKSHDFNTFLSLPGCQQGPHQPNKPVEPIITRTAEESPAVPPKPPINQIIVQPPKSSVERPPADAALVTMKLIVAPSLHMAIDKLVNSSSMNDSQMELTTDKIKPGTPCKHATCTVQYTTLDQEQSTRCRYHPGVPIFHEGTFFDKLSRQNFS